MALFPRRKDLGGSHSPASFRTFNGLYRGSGLHPEGAKHVGIEPVNLFAGDSSLRGSDLKPATLLVVQYRGKYAGRVKVGITCHRWTRSPRQGHGMHLGDDSVVLNRLICHPDLAPIFLIRRLYLMGLAAEPGFMLLDSDSWPQQATYR